MKLYIIPLLFLIFSPFASAKDKEKLMKRPWFKNTQCSGLEIKRYMNDMAKGPLETLHVDDLEVVQKMVKRIEDISPEGDEMRSFILKEKIELIFQCGNEKTMVEVYNGLFKTPSTGFNSDPAERNKEKVIYGDLTSLLFPDFNKSILKIKGLEIPFKDFFVTFTGTEPFDHAPMTVSGQNDLFLVKDKSGVSQVLKITSGQRSPQPHAFEVNKIKMTLLTHQSEDGKDLYPNYFQVMSK